MDRTPEDHIVFGRKGNSKSTKSNSDRNNIVNIHNNGKKQQQSQQYSKLPQFESLTRDEEDEDTQTQVSDYTYDEDETQESIKTLVESAQRLKDGFSNLDSKISDLKYIAKSIKKQYDIYYKIKEATEQVKTSNVFSKEELNEFIKIYQKEKEGFFGRVNKGVAILQDLRQAFATKQTLLRQFTENKIMDSTFLKSCEKDLQKSEADITKYTKVVLFYQNLISKSTK